MDVGALLAGIFIGVVATALLIGDEHVDYGEIRDCARELKTGENSATGRATFVYNVVDGEMEEPICDKS